ncbi:YolD-like family protein [Paenibacillus sp. S-38]|uniref:YolD-like family protein n=1 Tax=Paenibacillus sp. S-38 TaxID=3416710 RepID=UPI003CE70400
MIRDRGRIKWAGFYMPEQKKMLAKMYESHNDVKQPVLDEQRFEEFDEKLAEAQENGRELRISYYESKRIRTAAGHIDKIDPMTRMIVLVTEDRGLMRIHFSSITNIELT